jgi:predicted GH43/DUF377 family glycosyl hydrolase
MYLGAERGQAGHGPAGIALGLLFHRLGGVCWRVAVALSLLLPGTATAQEPLCRFPGPWIRLADPIRSTAGTHLSPLQIAADPSILRDGDRYRLWFTNADSRGRTGIATAESSDGETWTTWSKPSAPDSVMDLVLTSEPGAWDAPGIETAHVMRTPNGRYRMYYSGNRVPEGSVTYAIGMAESDDGLRWTRHGGPVLEPLYDWERPLCRNPQDPRACVQGGVLEPSVLYDPTERLYRMWYVGLGEKRGSFRTYRIGYATSSDGISWERNPEPVLELGRKDSWDAMWTSHVHVVADPKAGYHLFYFGSAPKDYKEGVEIQRGAIGHAYSLDGRRWQRNPANPILAPRPEQIDAWSLGGPAVLAEGSKLRMWYFASPGSGLVSNIVVAEAPCGP